MVSQHTLIEALFHPHLLLLSGSTSRYLQFFIHYSEQACDETKQECPMVHSSVFAYRFCCRNEWWRWFTHAVIHADKWHLVKNIFMQLVVGFFLEVINGPLRIVFLYVMGVIAGALASSVFDPTANIVGCSSGCYSILGAWVVMVTINWCVEAWTRRTSSCQKCGCASKQKGLGRVAQCHVRAHALRSFMFAIHYKLSDGPRPLSPHVRTPGPRLSSPTVSPPRNCPRIRPLIQPHARPSIRMPCYVFRDTMHPERKYLYAGAAFILIAIDNGIIIYNRSVGADASDSSVAAHTGGLLMGLSFGTYILRVRTYPPWPPDLPARCLLQTVFKLCASPPPGTHTARPLFATSSGSGFCAATVLTAPLHPC